MADDEDEIPPIKIVVVGDGAVGKTCLLTVFANGQFPTNYVPTVFDNTTKDHTFKLDGEDTTVQFDIWDTAGQEDLDRLRPLSYRGAGVFLVCFSVMHQASFDNIEFKWLPEIEHHRRKNATQNDEDPGHDAKIVLCGTKSDLRNDNNAIEKLKAEGKTPVSKEKIDTFIDQKLKPRLKKNQSYVPYIETSALKMTGVNQVFEEGLKLFLKSIDDTQNNDNDIKTDKNGGCCTML